MGRWQADWIKALPIDLPVVEVPAAGGPVRVLRLPWAPLPPASLALLERALGAGWVPTLGMSPADRKRLRRLALAGYVATRWERRRARYKLLAKGAALLAGRHGQGAPAGPQPGQEGHQPGAEPGVEAAQA